MAWKEKSVEEIAEALGVDVGEVREKQNLIQLIIKARKARRLPQSALAKKVGVTQGRIAQIESGIGTTRISFDILFNILSQLGYSLKIVPKRAA